MCSAAATPHACSTDVAVGRAMAASRGNSGAQRCLEAAVATATGLTTKNCTAGHEWRHEWYERTAEDAGCSGVSSGPDSASGRRSAGLKRPPSVKGSPLCSGSPPREQRSEVEDPGGPRCACSGSWYRHRTSGLLALAPHSAKVCHFRGWNLLICGIAQSKS